MAAGRFNKKTSKPSRRRNIESKSEARGDIFGPKHKGLVICRRCRNVFYKKSWHHPTSRLLEQANIAERSGVSFALCEACRMIEQHLFEGEIIIKDMPARLESECIHLVNNFGARAEARNPQHRIIAIEQQRGEYRITTTENQLAMKLAKKIQHVFGKVDLSITHAKEPYEVEHIQLVFLS